MAKHAGSSVEIKTKQMSKSEIVGAILGKRIANYMQSIQKSNAKKTFGIQMIFVCAVILIVAIAGSHSNDTTSTLQTTVEPQPQLTQAQQPIYSQRNNANTTEVYSDE